jgi:hypothetical protein
VDVQGGRGPGQFIDGNRLPSEPVGDTVATRCRVMLRKTSGLQLETSNLIGPGISFSNPTPDDHRTAFRLTAKKEAFYWPDEINFLLA